MWFLIPLRNLRRNVRRTALSLAIIGLGTALTFVVLGFVYSSIDIIQGSLLQRYGNIQIARNEVWNDKTDELTSPMSGEVISAVEEDLDQIPEVEEYSPQLSYTSLLVAGASSNPVNVVGIDPEKEVISYGDSIVRGADLEGGGSPSVLVGQKLAESLGISPGERIRLIVESGKDGGNTGTIEVAGIYTAQSDEVEGRQIYLPLSYSQELVGEKAVGRIAVKLDNRGATERIARELENQLESASLSLGTRTWKELSSFYEMLSNFFGLIFGFLIVVVSVLVFFIVLQVLTMSFLERSREVGTVRALGTLQGEIFRMFVVESFVLGALGAVLGLGLGSLIALVFNGIGINWTPPGSVEPVVLTVKLGWSNIWPAALISILATVISSFYPAFRMSREDIVDTLRVDE
jgi:putative ABC transport system permease protein